MKRFKFTAFNILVLCLGTLFPAGQAQAKKPFGGLIDKNHVGGKGTTTPKFVTDLEGADASLKRLKRDSDTLYGDQAALITRVREIKDFMNTSAARLGLISVLDSDLKVLEKSVNSVYAAAETAETIPAAREKAKKFKETLAPLKANVTAARERVDGIKNKTEPIRKKLETAADKLRKVELALWGVNEGVVSNIRFPVSVAAGCLKKIPAEKQACATKNVDEKADKADDIAREYDRVVRALLVNPEPWLPSVHFFDPFSAELSEIDALRLEIERLNDRLSAVYSQLKGLNAVLDRSFSFKFPYPDPTLTDPLRISDYKVEVGFRTIIKGVDAIESYVEDKISGFLWGILKKLGIGKYVDKLKEEANNAVNQALNAVHLNVALDMPSLSALDPFENAERLLSADIDAFHFPEIDQNVPSFGFPDVSPGVNFGAIKGYLDFLNPGGLNWDNPKVCDGVTYGCD